MPSASFYGRTWDCCREESKLKESGCHRQWPVDAAMGIEFAKGKLKGATKDQPDWARELREEVAVGLGHRTSGGDK